MSIFLASGCFWWAFRSSTCVVLRHVGSYGPSNFLCQSYIWKGKNLICRSSIYNKVPSLSGWKASYQPAWDLLRIICERPSMSIFACVLSQRILVHRYNLLSLASLEPKHHKLVEFGEGNICFCHLGIFEWQSRSLAGRKSYFADVYEAFLFYFERFVNVSLS